MHLLDADTLTHLHAQHPRVVERLRQCDDPEIGISIFTKAESCLRVRLPAEGRRRPASHPRLAGQPQLV